MSATLVFRIALKESGTQLMYEKKLWWRKAYEHTVPSQTTGIKGLMNKTIQKVGLLVLGHCDERHEVLG
jgi:hypothetical protein